MTKQTLRVSAIQMNCAPGQVRQNLRHAQKWIVEAAQQGAQLVLLPELMTTGYMTTEAIWNCAETIDGASVEWLRTTAQRHGIYLGFTFLEAEGEDSYNAFVLANPNGRLAGRVRKNPPASIEAYFYKAGSDRHVIETDLGRIGIGICYENLLYTQMCFLHDAQVDLVLWPSAAGRPKPFIPGDIRRFDRMLRNSRAAFAHALGVPVVMANRTGLLETELPAHFPYLKSSFPGLSFIADFDGTVKGELGDEEGVIVADVVLDKRNRPERKPKKYGSMWAIPVPWYAFVWPLTQRMGENDYAKNPRRKERAMEISGANANPAPHR